MMTDEIFLVEIREAIEDGKLEVSDWESDFIDSIGSQISRGRNLSMKQREILDRIHEKMRAW